MRTRFLLGPAGSGKTYRCLREIRAALMAAPDGPPLVLLAPKQATFELERQLLADPGLMGYTRLQILSFERMAAFLLNALQQSTPDLLSESGRVMVLRSLLRKNQPNLRCFQASARLPGFAQQLSQLLRALQHHGFSAGRLAGLAEALSSAGALGSKLSDLALLWQAYANWLDQNGLQDADRGLEFATEALLSATHLADPPEAVRLGGLWLDGFAAMTPLELKLLTALAPCWQEATLAFCLEAESPDNLSWLSNWAPVSRAYRACRGLMEGVSGNDVSVEILRRHSGASRFAGSTVLRHLESGWTRPQPFSDASGAANLQSALRLAVCAHAEEEACLAAGEILRFVRDHPTGARFRDCAVLVRHLDKYHDYLRRAFTRYEIPFFLDHRWPIAHHPLAQLTRNALRTVAFHWSHDDWFGALKSGLAPADDHEVDGLENESLARGWKGDAWLRSIYLAGATGQAADQEQLRQRLVPAFERFAANLAAPKDASPQGITGRQMASAVRELWRQLQVARQLEKWSEDSAVGETSAMPAAAHLTVWEQMEDWLKNLEHGFATEPLTLRDWLPVVEAGLAELTVGVVPPSLDQVLIGAIDRSRNPDLRLAAILGLNESIFPAPASASGLLSELEREKLAAAFGPLGPSAREQMGLERYYGYIACTRARERLVLTLSARNESDKPLNPSPILHHLQRLFPALPWEVFRPERDWTECDHSSELIPVLLRRKSGDGSMSALDSVAAKLGLDSIPHRFRGFASPPATIGPDLAQALYGPILKTSVSRLELFAACPFKFFVHSGLRAEDRQLFEPDPRRLGSFQHDVVARFHEAVQEQGKEWRDLTPSEARAWIGRVAERVAPEFNEGLFCASDQSAFLRETLQAALQALAETLVAWLSQNRFDPRQVELSFGHNGDAVPAWTINGEHGPRLEVRGKIDRLDLAEDPKHQRTWMAIYDYKSAVRKIDPVLFEHGIQIQLPAYLAALCQQSKALSALLGCPGITPAGMFYINLRGKTEREDNRQEALKPAALNRRRAYRHFGRFNESALDLFDQREDRSQPDQFNCAITPSGKVHGRYADLLEPDEFAALLAKVESAVRQIARGIFSGQIVVDPYRKGTASACDQCDYRGICRIDPWTHAYRRLRRLEPSSADPA